MRDIVDDLRGVEQRIRDLMDYNPEEFEAHFEDLDICISTIVELVEDARND